jgi:hypothetical protein
MSADDGAFPWRENLRALIADLQHRAAQEHRRADRAAALAARYKARAADGPEPVRSLHVRMATVHRQVVGRHHAAAALHEEHAARMRAWLAGEGGPETWSGFMSAVAAAIGFGSATAVVCGNRPAAVLAMSSDPMARAAHDLEATLGEGPGTAAMDLGSLVRVGGTALTKRWPLYGPAVTGLGVRSVIAVPLQLAASRLGALCGYDTGPGSSDESVSSTRWIADAVVATVLSGPAAALAGGADPDDGSPASALFGEGGFFPPGDYQAVVHQAAGMLSVRRGCGIDDAEALLRARAFAEGQPVERIAQSVLRGETSLW